ncbi:M23 family metallopeptidase [Streptomyces echinoruber]|uniref:Peptidase n=1 Tax=Streptomyces echinoruber TaxID=68898 RepID=A0A918R6B0_9ACTN|nr:M23 family metallopeptidase [Streptomyces echinoruber]GGZ85192.1 peptidase [Streptomyces echinoruber]
MFQRVTLRSFRTARPFRTFPIRTRAAVMAAGLGASVALGAGVAVAVGVTAVPGTESTAGAVRAQAVAQAKAAQAAQAAKAAKAAQATKAARQAEVAAAAKKAAAARKAAAVKKAAAKARKAAAARRAASWIDPVKTYRLSARFNQAGSHWHARHSGQDFAVPIGTDVVAAHGGTVVKAGPNGAGDGPAYGNAVVIRHADGTYSQYAHLSRIDVRIGQVVTTGQHIARSGDTGNSTGPHLHFEIRRTPDYGSAVDPVAFLRARGVTV